MSAGQAYASPQPAQSPAPAAAAQHAPHAAHPHLTHAAQTTGHYAAHPAWPAQQQQQQQPPPPPPPPQSAQAPHLQPLAAAPQPAAAQPGRPLARSGADVGFRVQVRMPRAAAAAAAAAQPALQSRPAGRAPLFVPVAAAADTKPAKPAKPAASRPASGGAAGWPPALRAYVTRCLKTAMPDVAASVRMHAALKQVISQADAAGERWTRDWDTLAMPSLEAAPAQPAQPSTGACVGMSAGTRLEPTFRPRQEPPTPKWAPRPGAARAFPCLPGSTCRAGAPWILPRLPHSRP